VTVEQSVIAACDSTITVVLCGVLHKNRLGLKATDALIKKLIIYAISRGVVTSLLAILTLILVSSTSFSDFVKAPYGIR